MGTFKIVIENGKKNIRKKINRKNENSHIPSILAQRGEEEGIKRKKPCHQERIANYRKGKTGIGGKKFEISGKNNFHYKEQKTRNQSHEEQEEENYRGFSQKILAFLERSGKIQLKGVAL